MAGKKSYTKFDFKLVEMAINLSSCISPQTSSLWGNKVSTYVSTPLPCLFLSSLKLVSVQGNVWFLVDTKACSSYFGRILLALLNKTCRHSHLIVTLKALILHWIFAGNG